MPLFTALIYEAHNSQCLLRDCRLPPRCIWDLRCSGILRSVYWQSVTDVSGQPNGRIFQGQAVLMFWDNISVSFSGVKQSSWTTWRLKMGPQVVSKRRQPTDNLRCVKSHKTEDYWFVNDALAHATQRRMGRCGENCRGSGRKRSWPKMRCHPDICWRVQLKPPQPSVKIAGLRVRTGDRIQCGLRRNNAA